MWEKVFAVGDKATMVEHTMEGWGNIFETTIRVKAGEVVKTSVGETLRSQRIESPGTGVPVRRGKKGSLLCRRAGLKLHWGKRMGDPNLREKKVM